MANSAMLNLEMTCFDPARAVKIAVVEVTVSRVK